MPDLSPQPTKSPCRCTVLVVDDNEHVLELVREFLEIEGYLSVFTDTSAAGALQRVDEVDPDIILLDWQLGESTARIFLDAYTERRPANAAPVILMTGRGSNLRSGESCGVASILSKPFSVDELVSSIARHCRCGAGSPG